jgi:hypothetical protein
MDSVESRAGLRDGDREGLQILNWGRFRAGSVQAGNAEQPTKIAKGGGLCGLGIGDAQLVTQSPLKPDAAEGTLKNAAEHSGVGDLRLVFAAKASDEFLQNLCRHVFYHPLRHREHM